MLTELRRHPRFWFTALLFALVIVSFLAFSQAVNRSVVVAFLDVGQGDAVYIKGPNGNQILYDAGPPSGAVLRELARVMPIWDRSIDVLVMSHPDLDHSGGIPDVLKRYRVGVLLEPGKFSGNGAYEAVKNAAERYGVRRLDAFAGMRIELGGGAYADILYPRPDTDVRLLDPNDASGVLRFVSNGTSVLLSGDLSRTYERALALTLGDTLRSDILKLGHHGSRTSSDPLWLSTVRPKEAIISAGRGNRYGHPHKETLEGITLAGIPYLTTFASGTIIFRLDEQTFRLVP